MIDKQPVSKKQSFLTKKTKQKIGFVILLWVVIYSLWNYYIADHPVGAGKWDDTSLFIVISSVVLACVFLFDFSGILFDPEEYKANSSIAAIVKKLRYRGVLFNNIAIILFLMTLGVIAASFYLIAPASATDKKEILPGAATLQIGASILLIFLVQILFKVFKYLLRVAAFYNARADAIEFKELVPDIELGTYMDLFTPDKYDISELEKAGLFDRVSDILKGKPGK